MKKQYITPKCGTRKTDFLLLQSASNENLGTETGSWGDDDDDAKGFLWEDAEL